MVPTDPPPAEGDDDEGGRTTQADATHPAVESGAASSSSRAGWPIWPTVDSEHYAIAREFARGGLGRILEAIDKRLDRPVAVKQLLTRGQDEARFVREALITARLQHPAIVPVHEGGRWPSGEPFYTMKMVSGRSLAEITREKLTLDERLALLPNVIAVADAIAYAHSQKIIHRDLKPANVLIGPFGETVVIDWGLAADLSEAARSQPSAVGPYRVATTGLTEAGAVMGTPAYMPPEQARGEPVDERADVYALGALLYDILAGAPPYQRSESEPVVRNVMTHPPPPLESRQPGVPEDLATIVRKAMSRQPEERYPTAKELADDLKRFQTGQLVSARKYSSWTLLGRWLRRNRAPVGVAAVFLLLLATTAAWSVRRVVAERNRAEARSNELTLLQAESVLDRDPTAALAWLKLYPLQGSGWDAARNVTADAISRGVAFHVLRHSSPVSLVAFSPDGRLLATAGTFGGPVRLWDVRSGKGIRSFERADRVRSLAFAPDGKIIVLPADNLVYLWNVASGASRQLTGHIGAVYHAAYSKDGSLLASASADRTVRVWELATGRALQVLKMTNQPVNPEQYNVTLVAWSADGKQLAAAGGDSVQLWDLTTATSRVSPRHHGPVTCVAFSPNSKLVASGSRDGTVQLWNVERGMNRVLRGHLQWVLDLAFSPDGNTVAAAGLDDDLGRTVWLWDIEGGNERILRGLTHVATSVSFSREGDLLVAGGHDGVRVWDRGTGESRAFLGQPDVYQVVFSPGGEWIASASTDGTVRVWRPLSGWRRGRVLRGHTNSVLQVAFAPDGRHLASASPDGTPVTWTVPSGERFIHRGHQNMVPRVAFSPDGAHLASAGFDRTVRVWNLGSDEARVLRGHKDKVWSVAFTPDGRHLASGSEDGEIILWDLSTGTHRLFSGHTGSVFSLAVSPDGAHLASGSFDKTARLWDLPSGESHLLADFADQVCHVAFSSDSRLVAAASWDGTAAVWNVITREQRVLRGHVGRVWSLAFLPDGETLVTASDDKTVRLWNLSTGQARVWRGHEQPVRSVAVSPDGRLVASGSRDHTVRLWDAATGSAEVVHRHSQPVASVAFSRDGKYLASGSLDDTAWVAAIEQLSIPPAAPADLRFWIERETSVVVGMNRQMLTP